MPYQLERGEWIGEQRCVLVDRSADDIVAANRGRLTREKRTLCGHLLDGRS